MSTWPTAPSNPSLNRNEVHVWRAKLDISTEGARQLWATLAPDERERADRFRFDIDRLRFISARGQLRALLGRYLGVEPQWLTFAYSSHGKPFLAESSHWADLSFNLSHAQGVALYAITRGRRVGVDVEELRPDLASREIAERFFAPGEVTILQSLPAALQVEAFFRCWTRKEAFIKAIGEGLSFPLDQFEVTLAPDASAAILHIHHDAMQARNWQLHHLTPGAGFVGALAMETNTAMELRCWQGPGIE